MSNDTTEPEVPKFRTRRFDKARQLLAAENKGAEIIVRDSDGAVFIRQGVAEVVIERLYCTLAVIVGTSCYDPANDEGDPAADRLQHISDMARSVLGIPL